MKASVLGPFKASGNSGGKEGRYIVSDSVACCDLSAELLADGVTEDALLDLRSGHCSIFLRYSI